MLRYIILCLPILLATGCAHTKSNSSHQSNQNPPNSCGPGGPSDCLINATNARAKGDKSTELKWLEIGCDQKVAKACFYAGKLHADSNRTEKARVSLKRACELKSVEGCRGLAKIWIAGFGVKSDPILAAGFLKQACELEHGPSCVQLGMLQVQIKEPSSLKNARASFTKGCDLKTSQGCFALGTMLMGGKGGPSNPIRGRELVEGACVAGVEEACRTLRNFPSKDDLSRAIQKKKCEEASGLSCYKLGMLWDTGTDGPRNLDSARQHYETACNNKISAACARLGQMYQTGESVTTDVQKAQVLFAQAREHAGHNCDGGDAPSCTNLGSLQATGRGGPKDETIARHSFATACQLGDANGCKNLGLLLLTGTGGEKNPRLAADSFKQACRLGDPESCALLEQAARPSH